MTIDAIVSQIEDAKEVANGPMEFTIEPGRGELGQCLTLYAHDEYEASSVLAGRSRRMFVAMVSRTDAGRDLLLAACRKAGVDAWECGGTTYRHDPMHDIPDAPDLA